MRGVLLLRRDAGTAGLLGLPPLLLLLATRDFTRLPEEGIRGLHGHSAEIGDEVCAVGVAGDVALGAPSSVLPTQRQHIAAVAAPVRADVVDGFEPVGDAVVDLLRVVFLYTEVFSHLSDIEHEMPRTPVFDFDIHFVTTFSEHFL